VADKLTQLVTDALSRAASEPAGLPLYAGKSDPGLFPNTAAAKPAAHKCLADELLRAVGTEPKVRYALSEKGWNFLLASVNPKQVLEDFVRVLEAREGEVGELLNTARRMADSLHGLKAAVSRVLPAVSAVRVETSPLAIRPTPPAPLPEGGGEKNLLSSCEQPDSPNSVSPLPSGRGAGGVGLAEPEASTSTACAALPHAIREYLAARRGPTDCTLPELFRALPNTEPLALGAFHDCLREMCADGALALHHWTGPLYAMPDPQFALMIGHGVAYYASLKG
jgi:hypothetical protein